MGHCRATPPFLVKALEEKDIIMFKQRQYCLSSAVIIMEIVELEAVFSTHGNL